MRPARLKQLQSWFFEELQPATRGHLGARRHVRSSGKLAASQRLSIYSSMYFARILEALQQDFPKVHEVLGDEDFTALCQSYLRAHPSRHPSLRYTGDQLPAFLAKWAPTRRAPWLAELACLERALVDAFDAPDCDPLAVSALTAVPPARWASLRFRFHPSLSRLRFGWNVDGFWDALHTRRKAREPCQSRRFTRVWRRGFTVLRAQMEPAEALALRGLVAGGTFGEACERWGDAQLAANQLATWLVEGLVVSIR